MVSYQVEYYQLLTKLNPLIPDNVNEYLKLAASADKQQLQRIKVGSPA